MEFKIGGQRSSLVVHWLSVAGNRGSNPGGEKKILFLSGDLMIDFLLHLN